MYKHFYIYQPMYTLAGFDLSRWQAETIPLDHTAILLTNICTILVGFIVYKFAQNHTQL
jgi:hypothetical protein